MHRIYAKMIRFGIVFVVVAAAGVFGAVWLIGSGTGGGGYAAL